MQNDAPKPLSLDKLAAMIANSFADMREEFAALETHLADLGQKVDQHRQETRDAFSGIHRLVGGTTHTLTDHEERLKELEGE